MDSRKTPPPLPSLCWQRYSERLKRPTAPVALPLLKVKKAKVSAGLRAGESNWFLASTLNGW